jgi:hypothetical protein
MRTFNLVMAILCLLLSIAMLIWGSHAAATYMLILAVLWRLDYYFGDKP